MLIIGFEFGAYTCGETDPTCEVCLVVISGTLDLIQPAPVDIVPQGTLACINTESCLYVHIHTYTCTHFFSSNSV